MASRTAKSGVVEKFRRRYVPQIVTAEGVPRLDKEFPKFSSAVKFDGHHPNEVLFKKKYVAYNSRIIFFFRFKLSV